MSFANKPNKHIYNSARWKKLRHRKFIANPVCEECGRKPTHTIDHVVPINQGGAVFDFDKLRSLCKDCNLRKTGSDGYNVQTICVTYEHIMYASNRKAWVEFCSNYGIDIKYRLKGGDLKKTVFILRKEHKDWGVQKNV